jgi:TetR/AcrR family transcriptional repressor of mexJK operon
LEATVEREAQRLEQATLAAKAGDADPMAQLSQCGEALLTLLLSPDVLAFDRLMSAEPYKGTDVVRRYFAAGPKRGRAVVARLIREAAGRGVVQIDDPQQAADDLLSLWLGATWREEIALGLRPSPTTRQIRARVRRGLEGFVRLYPPRSN